jgi:hypothetical protein
LALPRLKNGRLIVLNSVFFSVNYNDACGTGARTPALDQLRWLEETLAQASAAGDTVWLLMHVPPGINSFNSADSVTQGGPPATFWQPELTGRFLQLIRRYPRAISAAFAGHTHMDDFRVIRLDGEPVLLCKIAPAVSPIFGNNPGYQTYQYDRDSGALQNFQTYYLTNLDSARNPALPAEGRWAIEYDFREAYGLDGLTARTVDRLADRIKTDATARRNYVAFYAVSAVSEITPQTFDIYRCAIANITSAEFLTCLSGTPKPKRPPAFPDRRSATVPVMGR